MKLIAATLLLVTFCASSMAQDREMSPELLAYIQRTNESVAAFLDGDYNQVINAYESLVGERVNVSLLNYKLASESYLKLAEIMPDDSTYYVEKANEVYVLAEKWNGKVMVAERWDAMTIEPVNAE